MEGQVCGALSSVDVRSSWSVYFPGQEFLEDDDRVDLINTLVEFLDSPKGRAILSEVKLECGNYILPLDFQAFRQSSVGEEFSSLFVGDEKPGEPETAISCLGAAAHAVLSNKALSSHVECEFETGKINIRLYNCEDYLIALKSLKSAFIGKFVSIKGTVVRMSMVTPLVTMLQFRCPKCQTVIDQQFVDGNFVPPTKCIFDGCRSKTFTPMRHNASTVDYQKIRIQENFSAVGHEAGRMPRTVECELTEDLVDTCVPGDVVTVCGIVKVTKAAENTEGKASSNGQPLFLLYLDAKSLVNAKNRGVTAKGGLDVWTAGAPPHLQDFTSRDLEFVVRFASDNGIHIFRRLLHSICPSIYGHEILKAGILLALFGGVQKNVRDVDKVPIRGDIHVLVVGDPGLGKSQLLQAAASVAPRGIYVCGNTTTSAGLTVAVVKDSLTGDYVFEAGAMVLADRGVCCIDEFDKMSSDHQILLEAMEQQSVSVAKAGLVASLSSRTSVIAAANPVGGRYNRAKTVNENLKMGAAILSRFDLVYILLDSPNELLDQHLSEHVMALHQLQGEHAHPKAPAWNPVQQLTAGLAQNLVPVLKKLKLDKHLDGDFSPLPGPLLRKYIAYAKQYVIPRMSVAAAHILQQFYLRLRSERTDTPVTARQLESLVRLAEARAKLELREEITEQDALDVVEIMKESLLDKLLDEQGRLDFSRSGGMSQPKEVKRFMSALQQISEEQNKKIFTLAELIMVADDISLRVPDMDVFIETINDAGYLLKKGARLYEVAG